MMWPPKAMRSTDCGGQAGVGEDLVQPPKDSLDAAATEFFSSPFGQHLEQEFGATAIQAHVAEFVDADQVDAAAVYGRSGGGAVGYQNPPSRWPR
jgi:hypothetical protein